MKCWSDRETNIFYVNWWLTDHCNYNCSYCPQELKRSAIPFIDIRDAKNFVIEVKHHADKLEKIVQLELTGGEITEWAHLEEFLEYSKSLSIRNLVRTNGSKDLSYYLKIFPYLDQIEFIFHPEYSTPSHFIVLLSNVKKFENLSTFVTINVLPEKWRECVGLKTYIESKWNNEIPANLHMTYEDPIYNSIPLESYDSYQLESLENQLGNIFLQDNSNNVISTDHQTMILNQQNVFTSMKCMIGLEQIIVDAWGDVYKGHCRQGKCIGRIGDTIYFPDSPQICNRPMCPNAFDIQATKFS